VFLASVLALWHFTPLGIKKIIMDGLQVDRALIENSFVEQSQKARFLASLAPHSGDWLLALPMANNVVFGLMMKQCGLLSA